MTRAGLVCGAVVSAAALALAGCGRGATAGADSRSGDLGAIRSGHLTLTVAAQPLSSHANGPASSVGFEMDGDFAMARQKSELPQTDLRYTKLAGATRSTTRFISTANAAFVEVNGRTYRLDDQQVQGLRSQPSSNAHAASALGGLDVSGWVRDPHTADGGVVDGVALERTTGTVDPVRAVNDLAALAVRYGADAGGALPKIDGGDADLLRRSVRTSTFEMLSGRKDGLVRSLTVSFDIQPQEGPSASRSGSASGPESGSAAPASALGALAGARLTIHLAVDRPNQPVTVTAPVGAEPISSLTAARRP